MPLNPAMIYRRTEQGTREVYEKSHQFTQSERLILILLDGRLSIAGLQVRLPSLDDERLLRAVAKLRDAGLVEPAEVEPATATGGDARLQPEAIAHFLDQTELDPVTVAAGPWEGAPAGNGRAEAQGQPQASAGDSHARDGGAGPQEADVERVSGHSQIRSALADGVPGWDMTIATRFAITTINVPDRLDLQEERDRAETEEIEVEQRRVRGRTWMKRLLAAAVVAVFLAILYALITPLYSATSADRVGERLSSAFGRPVRVDATDFRVFPSPVLLVRGIDLGLFKLEEVALRASWSEVWAGLRTGRWLWAEARVAPLTLTPTQAVAAAKAIPLSAHALPGSIAAIRFDSIRVVDTRLFAGRYEATLQRDGSGRFGPLVLRETDGADGSVMELQLQQSAPGGDTDDVDFRLRAERWALPFGTRARWSDVRADGRLRTNVIEVASFGLAGFYGVTAGTLYAAADVEWAVTGVIEAANIDVEAVLLGLRSGAAPVRSYSALQGTATMKLAVAGRGASLEEAIDGSALSGPFQLRWAALNGINLGMAATRGSAQAGTTRFTEFGGRMVASAQGLRFEDAGGRAGAMAAKANFTVSPDLAVDGVVRVELGGQRVQAPINLRLAGTAFQPLYGQ